MGNQTDTRPERVVEHGSAVRREAVVVLAAGTVAAVVCLAVRAAGVDLTVRSGSGSREVGLGSAVVTAVVAAAAGAGLLHVLDPRTQRARRWWTIVALTVWGLSFIGPLSATSASAGATLATLHLLVGAVIVAGLRLSRVA
ncbi:MAG TPA: DUF6069 family protein [Acidimicrobiales bacterium]